MANTVSTRKEPASSFLPSFPRLSVMKMGNKIPHKVIPPGQNHILSLSLCELESVWLTLLMGSRELSWSLTKWVCADISPAAGLYAGGNMPSLSPPVFPLDSVQRALGAKRGEEEVLGIFFEESQCSLAVIAGSLRVGWSHTLRSRQKSVPGHS